MGDLHTLLEVARNFLLQRMVVFCTIFITSLFVIIPMGILQTKFSRECLLYSDVVYEYFRASGGRPDMVLFRVRFGPQSVCQYTVAVTSLFSFIYSVIMFVLYLLSFRKQRANKEDDRSSKELMSRMMMGAQMVLEVAVVVLMVVSACTVSHGFASLCDDVTDTGIAIFQVHRCYEAQRHNWRGYDGSNFFICLAVATAGCWTQTFLWSMQALLVLKRLWRLHILPALNDWMKESDSE